MKLKFSIPYKTNWGECLRVVINYHTKSKSNRLFTLVMTTEDGEHWKAETSVMHASQHVITAMSYHYEVCNDEGDILRCEWGLKRRVFCMDITKDYCFLDSWMDVPLNAYLYTNALCNMRGTELDEQVEPVPLSSFRRSLIIKVTAPQLCKGQRLAVIGSHPALGCWNPSRYILMTYCGCSEWILSLNVWGIPIPFSYKYVIVDDHVEGGIIWEEGDNRITGDITIEDGEVKVLTDNNIRICEPLWRAAGVSIPVFSLRSEHSYGVGDFGDLKRMIDWAVATGMKLIQVLPVNDTTTMGYWDNSCPYNIISSFALHPHYLDVEDVTILRDKRKMNVYRRQQQELNALNITDYEAVDRVKNAYINDAFMQSFDAVNVTNDYQHFIAVNAYWLMPYAAFCILRKCYGTAEIRLWDDYARYDVAKIKQLIDKEIYQYRLICFVQYHLHRQLRQAATYARSHGVMLKGDLPIGVSRDSVDVWMFPRYFNLDSQAGAPPDRFARRGQNWGFPTYCWSELAKDQNHWWHNRMGYMQQYFDALRIDHVLGYLRFWQIPRHAEWSVLGHFSPSLPFSVSEIEYFGLSFRKQLYTTPFITDEIISKWLGIHADYVKKEFLETRPYGFYALKEAYNTQQKVTTYFGDRNDENSVWIREGLYRLIAHVLFIEDEVQPGFYHPRIDACSEPVFFSLNEDERTAYMRLYNSYYYDRQETYWYKQGIKNLSTILYGTRMLICAEDLGMLPACVATVLNDLQLLSLELQRMPKQNDTDFGHLDANPYKSVVTLSTHDMPSLRMWWEESPERSQRYYVTMLQKEGRAPEHLPAHLAEEIIARHLYCPSMLCVLSWQDWMAMDAELRAKNIRDERINIPSDPHNRWQYRMHVTIEQLLKANRLNEKINMMIKRSRR